MLIDTHIHLDAAAFDDDRTLLLDQARAAGVAAFVLPSVDVAGFSRVTKLAERHEDVAPALGIHPLYTATASESDIELLQQAIALSAPVALGEIGLDYHVAGLDRERQSFFYEAQLSLAQRFRLPVLLHVRKAQDAVLKQLRRHPVAGGIAHAFNGSRQQADAFIALGFKLGFGGAMTFDGSRRIRTLARDLPLESIVLETDAPDMPPAWGQGERNLPDNILRYAHVLADIRGLPVSDVIAQTGRNALEVLPTLSRLTSISRRLPAL